MKSKTAFIFDLDGTLIDSSAGIIKSVKHALNHFSIKVESDKELYRFIGPPLQNSFMDYYGLTKEEADTAIDVYREVFSDDQVYNNYLYDGIKNMIIDLSKRNYLYIATTKLEFYAKQIIEQWELGKYFQYIGGSHKGKDPSKASVLEQVIKNTNIDTKKALMIGDKEHDIFGGKKHNIETVGILYGFGTKEELEVAQADHILNTVEDLWKFLKNYD